MVTVSVSTCRSSDLFSVRSRSFYSLLLSHRLPNSLPSLTFSTSLRPRLSFPSSPSRSLSVCWIDSTSGYIFCPHFCSPPLASPPHSSLECRPTVGYYCLIKGRLGRRRPDKSIKLPLAVPEGEMDRDGFCPSERISQGAPLPNGVRGGIC